MPSNSGIVSQPHVGGKTHKVIAEFSERYKIAHVILMRDVFDTADGMT